jgi:hypothetical protein
MVAALDVLGPSERMCDRLATHSVAAQGAAEGIFRASVTRVLPAV